MKKNKVVFLDRDGTINIDYGYVYKKNKLDFIPGVIEGMKKLYENGYQFIIITNQSGIGRKYFTLDQYYEFTNYMINELEKKGIKILDVYFCPHTDKDNCECRKPKTKMFYEAIKNHNIDISNSYVVGDKIRDLSISKTTDITGILISNYSDEYICKNNMIDVADYIIENSA